MTLIISKAYKSAVNVFTIKCTMKKHKNVKIVHKELPLIILLANVQSVSKDKWSMNKLNNVNVHKKLCGFKMIKNA